MKRLLLVLIVVGAVISCEKDPVTIMEKAPETSSPIDLQDAAMAGSLIDVRDATMALELMDALIDEVTQMMSDGIIGNGPGHSMLSKLESIKKKLEDGKTAVALSKLTELRAHLEALGDSGVIDPLIVEQLIADLKSIECEIRPFDGDGDGSPCNLDCDDENPDVYPEMNEICDNGVDDDCDGLIDDADSDCGPCADDWRPPYLICTSWLEKNMEPEGVTVSAEEFLISYFDNCTASSDLIISYDQSGIETSKTFSCEDLGPAGNSIIIEVWVIDEAGLGDFCQTTLRILDPLEICGAP